MQVNRTFQELAALRDAAGAWQELGPQIRAFLNSSLELQVLRVRTQKAGAVGSPGPRLGPGARPCPDFLQELLLAPGTAPLLEGILNGTTWTMSALARFLAGPAAGPGLSWQQALDEADGVVGTLSQLLEVRAPPLGPTHRLPAPR